MAFRYQRMGRLTLKKRLTFCNSALKALKKATWVWHGIYMTSVFVPHARNELAASALRTVTNQAMQIMLTGFYASLDHLRLPRSPPHPLQKLYQAMFLFGVRRHHL